MNSNIKIPPIPFKVGIVSNDTLCIEQLTNAGFDLRLGAFIGGEFKHQPLSHEGNPVWIRIKDDKVVIERLVNCVLDEKSYTYVGGDIETLLELTLG